MISRAMAWMVKRTLEEALATQFRDGTQSSCFSHFRGKLESKLLDIGISKSDPQEFVKDILGNLSQLEEGLVDADRCQELRALQKKWDERMHVF